MVGGGYLLPTLVYKQLQPVITPSLTCLALFFFVSAIGVYNCLLFSCLRLFYVSTGPAF